MTVAVLVAGMHRSGTSATAGALNIVGVPLGEKLMPPTPENAKGYWENLEVVDIHDTLLAALDFAWDDVRPLPMGWEKSAAASAARNSLRDWILREFARTDLWAVKDPRLCRFIPLWLDVLRELAIEPAVLIVARNSAEVADSIRARDRWPEGFGEMLWLRHLSEAEAASRGIRRCAMTYDQLLASPVQVLTTVASRLQLRLPRAPRAVAGELQAFIDANARHQRTTEGKQRVEPSGMAKLNQQLYEALTNVGETDQGWDQVQRLAGLACEGIDRQSYCLLALADGVARYRRAEAEARAECARIRRDLIARVNWFEEAAAREQGLQAHVEWLKSELSASRGERDTLAARVEWLHREVQAGVDLASGLRAELESLQRRLDASQRHLGWSCNRNPGA